MHRQSNRVGCCSDAAARMRLHGKRPAHSRRSEQERFEMSGPCWPHFCGTKKRPPLRLNALRTPPQPARPGCPPPWVCSELETELGPDHTELGVFIAPATRHDHGLTIKGARKRLGDMVSVTQVHPQALNTHNGGARAKPVHRQSPLDAAASRPARSDPVIVALESTGAETGVAEAAI